MPFTSMAMAAHHAGPLPVDGQPAIKALLGNQPNSVIHAPHTIHLIVYVMLIVFFSLIIGSILIAITFDL